MNEDHCFLSTSVSHQLPSSETESEPREHTLSMVAHKNQSIESVEIENFCISSIVSHTHINDEINPVEDEKMLINIE